MSPTSTRRSPLRRLRAAFAAQVQLWDSTQRALEPWRAEGPLRWSGARLDGAVLPEPVLLPLLHDHEQRG